MFVTNWISTTKIQKISEITNFFRHYFLSRTEVSSYTKGLGVFMVKPCGYQITKGDYSDNIRMNEKDKLLFMFQKSMS